MRFTRRSLLAGAAATPFLSATNALAQATTTLDVLYCNPSFSRFHEPVAQMFMEKNPSIKIQFRAPAAGYDEGHQTVLRSALTNQLPDIYYSGFHLIGELARTLSKRDQIMSLDAPMAAEGADFRKANYAETMLELGRVDGKQYGLPFNASNPITYVNLDLLKKAGVTLDTFPATFEGVIALAAKINDPANGIVGMSYDVHGWPDGCLFEAMITQAGGSLLNAKGDDVAFDGEIGLNAIKTFRRMVTEGGMQPIDRDQIRQNFGAGKVGIYYASPANLQQVTGLVGGKFDLRTTTFPIADKAKGRIPTGGNCVVAFARDEAKRKAAWQFIKFVTSPEAQKPVVEMSGYLPTNLRASGPDYLGAFYDKNPNFKTPILQIDRAGPWGSYPGGNSVRIWRGQRDVIAQVMRGEKTPEAGHAEIVKLTRELMKG